MRRRRCIPLFALLALISFATPSFAQSSPSSSSSSATSSTATSSSADASATTSSSTSTGHFKLYTFLVLGGIVVLFVGIGLACRFQCGRRRKRLYKEMQIEEEEEEEVEGKRGEERGEAIALHDFHSDASSDGSTDATDDETDSSSGSFDDALRHPSSLRRPMITPPSASSIRSATPATSSRPQRSRRRYPLPAYRSLDLDDIHPPFPHLSSPSFCFGEANTLGANR